ncbi:hypothetical protein [Rugamonas sp.]|uniref:hypothetical protein n=1 Tax=Rugamonas sp. TaxID=1926287 RepID=UPI0025E67E0B|nr:hypothetical protein [Rugamonas sp.]
MSLVEHLMGTRTSLDLAKELARTALDNAQLRRRVHDLEVQQFWLTRPAPASMPPEGILHHALVEQMEREAAKTIAKTSLTTGGNQ